MPTKEELETENAELRARVQELETAAPAPAAPAGRKPRPEQLSAGEVDDLRNAGITVSPFDGRTLNALDEGIEPATPEARANAERERAGRK